MCQVRVHSLFDWLTAWLAASRKAMRTLLFCFSVVPVSFVTAAVIVKHCFIVSLSVLGAALFLTWNTCCWSTYSTTSGFPLFYLFSTDVAPLNMFKNYTVLQSWSWDKKRGPRLCPLPNLTLLLLFCVPVTSHSHLLSKPEELTNVLEICNIVFTSMFTLEMILKLTAFGFFEYLRNPYNIFDGIIVIIRSVKRVADIPVFLITIGCILYDTN